MREVVKGRGSVSQLHGRNEKSSSIERQCWEWRLGGSCRGVGGLNEGEMVAVAVVVVPHVILPFDPVPSLEDKVIHHH